MSKPQDGTMPKHGDNTMDQYSNMKDKLYVCDQYKGISRNVPSTPPLSGGDAAQARIRAEQTRMFTEAQSTRVASQFPDQKSNRRKLG